jgi:hypothetical protein
MPLNRPSPALAWLALSLAALGLSTLPALAQCGGVISLAYNQSPTNKKYLRVILAPAEAVRAGAGWRLSGDTNAPYITNSDLYVQLTSNGRSVEYNTNVPGWDAPVSKLMPVALTNEINVISNAPYLIPSRLDVTPFEGLNSTGYAGGPFSPSNVTYILTNPGQSPCVILPWRITKTADWLSLSSTNGLSPTNGFLQSGASTSVIVTVNTNANSLQAGTYTATLAFTNSFNGLGNTKRIVTLSVAPPPTTLNGVRSLGDGRIAMTLQGGVTNRVYSIQFSTNLPSNWTDVLFLTNLTGTNVFTDTPASDSTKGFYRAKQQPP